MQEEYNTKVGLFYGILTFTMWGLFPILFKSIKNIDAVVILSYRIIFSMCFLILFAKARHRFSSIKAHLADKKMVKKIFISAFLLALNWGVYIYGTNSSQILEVGLGQLMAPLAVILLGAIILKEKLNLQTKIAILLMIIAVSIQVYSLHKIPIIALTLAMDFGFYAILKKKIKIDALDGIFIENLFMFPFGLAFACFSMSRGVFLNLDSNLLVLILSGLLTILPLLTMSMAAKNLPMTTMGIVQYITPTIGILLAIFVYNENVNIYKMISFTIIMIAILISILPNKKG